MKRFLSIASVLILSTFPPLATARYVKFCTRPEGAVASARVFDAALLGELKEPQVKKYLKQVEHFCYTGDVKDDLNLFRKGPVVVRISGGSKKNLEAFVWYTKDKKPKVVKYYWVDIYKKGKLLHPNVILIEETPTSIAEYSAAKRAIKEAAREAAKRESSSPGSKKH